jgi:transcriptional regulator with XRE-family HTH domain
MTVSGTTVVRRQLGRRLRRLREVAGKTIDDVEAAKVASASKVWRIESGRSPVKIGDIRALCWLYKADEQTTDALAALAAGTNVQDWWEDYGDVMNPGVGLYIGLEEAAHELHDYEAELVPGLFQTADYTRAVNRAERPEWPESVIDRRVAFRMERQRIVLGQANPLRMAAVLNEAVLLRRVGGPEVMAAQLVRLRELTRAEHLDIRVLPYAVGAHAAMSGSFIILDFADSDDPTVVYADTFTGARYMEQAEQIAEYRRVFDLIYKQTISFEEYDSP